VLLKDLIAFAVFRIYIMRSCRKCVLGSCLQVIPDFRKELSSAFGDYYDIYDGSDITSKATSVLCLALYPCCNTAGS
jgi:hypothetical protein